MFDAFRKFLSDLTTGDKHPTRFEDNLLWRAADLLGISSRERIELRRQVAGEQARDGQDA